MIVNNQTSRSGLDNTSNSNNDHESVQGELLLEVKKVAYTKRDKKILTDVSLSLHSREIITLIGPNGAGKTSLIRILLGLSKASSGMVERKPNLSVGYVPQRINIPEVMPLRVYDFLNLTAKCSHEACREILAQVSCEYLLLSPMQDISGGEMKRVLLARALLKKPQLLVLDEPASGMDIMGQQSLYDMIKNIRDNYNCCILMVSHDLHLVMAATDRVICLNTHVCCTGHPDDVSEDPEYLKLFGGAIDGLALYSHHHDHEHDLQGNIVTDPAQSQVHIHTDGQQCDHHKDVD